MTLTRDSKFYNMQLTISTFTSVTLLVLSTWQLVVTRHATLRRSYCLNNWWFKCTVNTDAKMSSFSSLPVLEVVKMTTSSAARDENFIKVETFAFQWKWTSKFCITDSLSMCCNHGIPCTRSVNVKRAGIWNIRKYSKIEQSTDFNSLTPSVAYMHRRTRSP